MKHCTIVLALALLWGAQGLYAQKIDTVDASSYIVADYNPTQIWVYRLGDMAFLDLFSDKGLQVNGVEYMVRIRKYSTGTFDTALYRVGSEGLFRAVPLANGRGVRESLVLPRRAYVGQTWMEGDSSWSYQVTGTNSSLTTPTATYEKLIEVTATPLKGGEGNAKPSRIYFAPGIGMVAYTVDGKIAAYLRSMRKVTGKQEAVGIDPE